MSHGVNLIQEADMVFPAHIINHSVQTCQEHCHNTAKYAGGDLKGVSLYNAAYLAGLLHDLGKFTEKFKRYITSSVRGDSVQPELVIHSFAGVYFLMGRYHQKDCWQSRITAELLAYAIGAHHGLFDCVDQDKKNGFIHRQEKQPHYEEEAIKNFLATCRSQTDIDSLFLSAKEDIAEIFDLMSSIVQGDQDEVFFYIGMVARLLASAVIDGDRRDTAEFMNHVAFPERNHAGVWQKFRLNLEKYLDKLPKDFEISCIRQKISNHCLIFADNPEGIYRLNVPTGGGKTLSSLRYALAHAEKYGKNRIIYAAPFLSILDQNAEVIKEAVGDDSLVLVHHSNVIKPNDEEKLTHYDLLAETWDSPVVITTLVQLLNTFFSGRSDCVRRFQSLCNSVIIIDEVQSVPDNLLTLFNLTLNFLAVICHATIVLCSATQPCFENLKHKLNIFDKPMIPEAEYAQYRKIFKRTKLIPLECVFSDLPEFVFKLINEFNSVLVICNMREEASTLYNQVRDFVQRCFHLSASMCVAHRKQVLSHIYESLGNGEKVICISTQVIEAGVDISFDSVVRLSAGMDNIIQASGRCNRNGESTDPLPVYIARCKDEQLSDSLRTIIERRTATEELLVTFERYPNKFCNDLSSDLAIQYYYRKLFGSLPSNHFDYPLNDRPSLYKLLSDNSSYCQDSRGVESFFLRQAFKMAGEAFEVFNADTETVIAPYGEGVELIAELSGEKAVHDLSYIKELVERAKPYTVSVYRHQLEALQRENAISALCNGQILVLRPEWYGDTGIVRNLTGDNEKCNILIL